MSRRAALTCLALSLALGCVPKKHDIEVKKPPVIVAEAPTAPDLVDMGFALVRGLVPAGASTTVMARLRVEVKPIAGADRKPAGLCLVIDTSGSMAGKAIDDAKAAGLALLDAMGDGDQLTIVTFDSRAEVRVKPTVLGKASRAGIRRAIAAMKASGTTAMAEGLSLALQQMSAHPMPGVNRLVLLGDGVPNDVAPLAQIAGRAGSAGFHITALGLGVEYDETLMGRIAELSGGKFHYVPDSAKVAAVFEQEVLRMSRAVGENALLRLIPGPGVSIAEVVGHPSQRQGAATVVSLGGLTEGERRDLVIRLVVPARRAGATIELVDGELGYSDAVVGGGMVQERAFLGVKASADAGAVAASHDAAVERSVARAQVAALVVDAVRLARGGNLAAAQARVDAALAIAREQGRALADSELQTRAEELPELRKSLAVLVPAAVLAPPVAPLDAPRPAPAPAEAPARVREQHSAAVKVIQGS